MSIFKVRTSATSKVKAKEVVACENKDVAAAIDSYVQLDKQIKELQGDAAAPKEVISSFAKGVLAGRAKDGKMESFKVQGLSETIMFTISDRGGNLVEADADAFEEKYGKKARKELIDMDLGSVKFNAEVLAKNFEKVEKALSDLGIEGLIEDIPYRAKKGALEKAAALAKNSQELEDMIRDLKLITAIKAE